MTAEPPVPPTPPVPPAPPGPSAPPVVLVPGMLCDADLWAGVGAALPGDVRHAAISEPSIGAMAEQVLAAVDGEFVLVGLSLGAIVGFEVARRAPGRLAGLAAVSTNAGAPRPEQLAGWRRAADRTAAGGFDAVAAEQVPLMFAEREPAPPLRERFLAMAGRIGPEVFRRQLAAQATRVDAHGALAGLGCPVLALCGDRDALCPPDFHRAVAASAPRGELAVLPGAGHLLTMDQPAGAAAALGQWLARTAA